MNMIPDTAYKIDPIDGRPVVPTARELAEDRQAAQDAIDVAVTDELFRTTGR